MRGTALAEGIGEKLTRITQVPDCFVLIGKPGINVSTKAAYESLQLDKISSHPDIDGMIGDIERGDLLAMTQKMGNVLSRNYREISCNWRNQSTDGESWCVKGDDEWKWSYSVRNL